MSFKVVVCFFLNEWVLIGWGGDWLEMNYYVIKLNERWVYDIFILFVEVKSSKLEDYGIYGVKVMVLVFGMVVLINNNE